MAKFDISLKEGRERLENYLCTGRKGVAYVAGEVFTIDKISESSYLAYYSSLKTGLIKAKGQSITEAINNVCVLSEKYKDEE
ncbi:MAG: hypothetical protein M0R32_06730 [Candidatus Cloacimonetes bacterium]|jgi:hypothetical protein|nr:hypothetical protein [Candidatus Cloacimonadota bacterium]